MVINVQQSDQPEHSLCDFSLLLIKHLLFILNLIYFLAGKKCMAISAITTFFNTVSNQFQLVGTISLLSQSMITTSLPLSIPSFPTNSLLYSHQVFHKCSNNLMHKFVQNVRDILQKLCFEKPIPYWYKVNNSLKKNSNQNNTKEKVNVQIFPSKPLVNSKGLKKISLQFQSQKNTLISRKQPYFCFLQTKKKEGD